MQRRKSRGGKSQGGEVKKWEDQRKSGKQEDAGARKGGKVAIHCVFSNDFWIRKVERVRSQLARGEMKSCTLLWREAQFEVKMCKTHHSRTTFGSWAVKKVHAVVAQSTFPSQKCQKPTVSDHCWKLRCPKSARRCGAKHISKSKCTKHARFGPLLEVEMSKKCAPLWREAHFQVKMCKTHHSRTTFGRSDVEKMDTD